MADPDSILQLGIEATRKGEKDEARRLFRLLTREHPENIQGWLWLAGVAADREERQAALEQVLRLDPRNEMAIKGLQALGVTPKAAPPPAPPSPPPSPAPAPVSAMPNIDEDDPFAQLDALSEVMATDAGPVRRDPAIPRPETISESESPAPTSALPPRPSRTAEPSRTSRPSTSWARGSGGNKPAKPARSGNLFGSLFRRSGPPSQRGDDMDEEMVPAKRSLTPLTLVLLILLLISCVGLTFIFLSQRNQVATSPQTQATAQAATSIAATTEASLAPTTPPEPQPEPTVAPVEEPAPEPTPEPTPEPIPPTPDPVLASPALVSPGTELTSNGWAYDFNQPTYAAPIIGPLNGITPNNGRFVVVLVFVRNTTGQDQPVPLDFFVLKDAQGRVWTPRLDASDAYLIRGINADLSHSEPVPADGFVRSVAILFDVAPDATDLVFFARSNPGQGWLVLRRV
ncbi:hypothetical protein [Chloroflexus sp.]|uniref:tetratricopeptide repeat protein n=1 Tax=Chloroflexus sp. TaxID=1904827 RepID=UPI002ADD6EF9|nr:hypothetical protein [Chloroflexus sp.]